MISVKQALEIHEIAVQKFGGSVGLRDLGGLESALARPFQTFGGEDLYPDYFSKAAAIGESIKINASNDELYNFVISISTYEKNLMKLLNG